MTTYRRGVWIILGVVGLILLSLGGIFLDAWLGARSAVERERRLVAERIAVLRAERVLRPVFFEGGRDGNSWELFTRAVEAFGAVPASDLEAFPSFQEDDHPRLNPEGAEKVLAALQPALADLKRALQQPWTEPDYPFEEGHRLLLPNLSRAIQFTKLLADGAQFRHDAGRTDESVELLILAFGVGTRCPVKGFLVNHLVANGCAHIALERLRSLLAEHRFDRAQLKSLREAVELVDGARTDLMEAYRRESLMARQTALDFVDGSEGWDRELGPGAGEFYSRWITAARFFVAQEVMLNTMERSRNLPFAERQRVLETLQQETTTNVVTLLLRPLIAHPWKNEDRLTLEFSLARISLAAAIYREERGSYPSSPADLVPTYLSKVPVDVINARPFGYFEKEGAVTVYSWGGDGDDDGGKPIPVDGIDNFDEDGDMVWTVKRAK